MRPISQKVKETLEQEPNVCARSQDGNCDGRITWEHALIYAGKQIDEVWAIIKLCEYHHAVGKYQDGGNLLKEKNEWIALCRATDQELDKYPKANYKCRKQRLDKIYGNHR